MSGLLHALIEDAAREAGCSIAQIVGRTRRRPIVWARQKAMRRAYEEGFSIVQIGLAFGGRDHTTVLYAAGVLSGKRPAFERGATS